MLLLLLPWLLLEQRPADLSFQHEDGAVRVEKCSQEGQGIRTTGRQWPICCLSDQGESLGFLSISDIRGTLSRHGTGQTVP